MGPAVAFPPSAPAAAVASSAPSYDAANNLPFTGPPSQDGAAQAVVIAPSAQPQAAADPAVPSGNDNNLLWLMMLGAMAIPAFVMMTLVATVLIRR